MGALGDVVAALRQVLTMEHRIEALTKEIADLKAREEDTRERLIRLEVIIEEARGRGRGHQSPGNPQLPSS